MERKQLPLDIIRTILDFTDQQTKYVLGQINRKVSRLSLCKLWSKPLITNPLALRLFGRTLHSTKTAYPYKEWVKSLSLHMMINDNEECTYLSDDSFERLSLLNLQSLSLQHIDLDVTSLSPMAPPPYFEDFIESQLSQGLAEIHIHVCSSTTVNSLVHIIRNETRPHLKILCFLECAIFDYHIERISEFSPNLNTLKLDRCGCFSDDGLVPVAKNCRHLSTLLVTLPSNIIQSNTITLQTVWALKKYCLNLKTFMCNGQARIIEHVDEGNSGSYSFDIVVESLPSSCT